MKHLRWLIPAILILLLLIFLPQLFGKKLVIQRMQKLTEADIEIEKANLSWFGPQMFHHGTLKSANFEGGWEQLEARVPFWKLGKLDGIYALSGGYLHFCSERLGEAQVEELSVRWDNQQIAVEGQTTQGEVTGAISIEGTVSNHFSSISLNGSLSSFPLTIIDSLCRAKGLLVEAFGPSFDLQGSGLFEDGSGKCSLSFASFSSHFDLQMSFDRNFFYLAAPLDATFQLTQRISESLFREINPLFVSRIGIPEPIAIHFEPEGFALPYRPFRIQRLALGPTSLDLGKIRVEKGPLLDSLLSFLKYNIYNGRREMTVWPTPIEFSMQKGVIDAKRVDFLLGEAIHICTWGHIDLIHDRLEMYLGLPAETLYRAFSIKGLNPDFVLKLPIRGTLREPKLETGEGAARLATLAAAQKIKLPGKAGKLIGSFAETVTQLENDPSIPPPTSPLPWK